MLGIGRFRAVPIFWQAEAGISLPLMEGIWTGLPTTPEMKPCRFCRAASKRGTRLSTTWPLVVVTALLLPLRTDSNWAWAKSMACFHRAWNWLDCSALVTPSCTYPLAAFVMGPARKSALGGRAFATVCWGFKLVKIWLVRAAATAEVTAGSVPMGTTVFSKPCVAQHHVVGPGDHIRDRQQYGEQHHQHTDHDPAESAPPPLLAPRLFEGRDDIPAAGSASVRDNSWVDSSGVGSRTGGVAGLGSPFAGLIGHGLAVAFKMGGHVLVPSVQLSFGAHPGSRGASVPHPD